MFAVKLEQDNFLERPIFNVVWETREYITYSNGTKMKNKHKRQLIPCTEDHWKYLPRYNINWENVYKQANLSSFLCPRLEDSYMLGGTYNSEKFYHSKLTVMKCNQDDFKNETNWKPTCASQVEQDEYFLNKPDIRFMIYINNYLINPIQPSDYLQNFLQDSIFFSIQKNAVNFVKMSQKYQFIFNQKGAYQTADIYLTENQINSDESIMPYNNFLKQTFLRYEIGNLRQQYVVGITSDILADFYFRKDPILITINRSYQKLGQIISYIGGFSQLFIVLSAFIVKFYNQYVYLITLANKIYDFKFDEKQDQKKNKQINKVKTLDISQDKSPPNQQFKEEVEDNQSSPYVRKKRGFVSQQSKEQLKLQLHSSSLNCTQNIKSENVSLQLNQFDQYKDENKIEENILKIKKKMSALTPMKKGQKIVRREQEGLVPLQELIDIIQSNKPKSQSLERKNKIKEERIKQSSSGFKQEAEQLNSFTAVVMACQTNSDSLNVQQQLPSQKFFNNQSKEDIFKFTKSNSKKISPILVKKDSINPETPREIQDEQNEFQNEKEQKQSQNNENTILSQQQMSNDSPKQIRIGRLPSTKAEINRGYTTSLSMATQKRNTTQWGQDILEKLGLRDRKEFLDKEFQFLLKRDTSISISFHYFLYKLTCGKLFKSNMNVLIDRATKQMKKELDIFDILNKLKQIDKFKQIFLDKNQETLFNFFPKPIFLIEEKNENLSLAEITEKFKRSVKQLAFKDNENTNSSQSKQKLSKKLNVNLRTIQTIKKAANIFKKPLNKQVKKFNSMWAYQKLYEAYETISKSEDSEISTKSKKKLTYVRGIQMQPLTSTNKIESESNLSQTQNQHALQRQSQYQDTSVKNPKISFFSQEHLVKNPARHISFFKDHDENDVDRYQKSNLNNNELKEQSQ